MFAFSDIDYNETSLNTLSSIKTVCTLLQLFSLSPFIHTYTHVHISIPTHVHIHSHIMNECLTAYVISNQHKIKSAIGCQTKVIYIKCTHMADDDDITGNEDTNCSSLFTELESCTEICV